MAVASDRRSTHGCRGVSVVTTLEGAVVEMGVPKARFVQRRGQAQPCLNQSSLWTTLLGRSAIAAARKSARSRIFALFPWRRGCAPIAAAAMISMLASRQAQAQEMEPRSYSAVPINTNFLIASYQRTTGDVGLDPSLPIANVKATIDFRHSCLQPHFRSFRAHGQRRNRHALFSGKFEWRCRCRGEANLPRRLGRLCFSVHREFGSPALTPAEFARRTRPRLGWLRTTGDRWPSVNARR